MIILLLKKIYSYCIKGECPPNWTLNQQWEWTLEYKKGYMKKLLPKFSLKQILHLRIVLKKVKNFRAMILITWYALLVTKMGANSSKLVIHLTVEWLTLSSGIGIVIRSWFWARLKKEKWMVVYKWHSRVRQTVASLRNLILFAWKWITLHMEDG